MPVLRILRGLSGSGKCLTDRMLLKVSGKGFVYPSELFTNPRNQDTWEECNENYVLTKDGYKALEKGYSKKAYEFVRLRLSNGSIIEGSKEHKILCFDGIQGTLIWKSIEDLSKESVVISCRSLGNDKDIDLNLNYEKPLPNNMARNSKEIVIPSQLTEQISSLLGYLVANGSKSNKSTLQFSSNNEILRIDFEAKLLNAFGIACYQSDRASIFSSIEAVQFIEFLYGKNFDTARTKIVPQAVRKSSSFNIKAFIGSLIDCDSSLSKNTLEYSTASEQLAREVQTLLLGFGVNSYLSPKYLEEYNHTYWRLCIYSQDLDKYFSQFPSLKYNYKSSVENHNSNRDLYFGLHNFIYNKVQDLKNKLSVGGNGLYRKEDGTLCRFKVFSWGLGYSNKCDFTRASLSKFASNIDLLQHPEFRETKDLCNEILDSNFRFLKVVSKETIVGDVELFDFSVEEEHSYIANGIVVHNSTYAKELVARDPKWKRVNRDSLRLMVDGGGKWSRAREKAIELARDTLILAYIREGYNVVVDDTNLSSNVVQHLKDLVLSYASIEVNDTFLSVSVEDCIARDVKREASVGKDVILKQWCLLNDIKKAEVKEDPTLPSCVIFDIDGCLAEMNGRSPYEWDKVGTDTVNNHVKDICNMHFADGKTVFVFSGRDGSCYDLTHQWLRDNFIYFHHLFLREKDDQRKDSVIKEEIYRKEVEGKYNVKLVVDDRMCVLRLWTRLGLPVISNNPLGLEF